MNLLVLSAIFGSVNTNALLRRTVYSSSVRDPTDEQAVGTANTNNVINPGVAIWLTGDSTHNVLGNLNNYGQLTISQTDEIKEKVAVGLQSNFQGSSSTNGNLLNAAGALISVNDYGSSGDPEYLWFLNSMENRGTLQMCGRGDLSGSQFDIRCQTDCYNYGLMDYEQFFDNEGNNFHWRNAAVSRNAAYNLYNYGSFRLNNVTMEMDQNILGDGCWIIARGASLYLEDNAATNQNPSGGPTWPSQNIYFRDSTAILHIEDGVYVANPTFGARIWNYGVGKALEVESTINSYSYSTTTGILNIQISSSRQINFNIGLGYDSTQFYTARNPSAYSSTGYPAIFYRLAPPAGQATPATCFATLRDCGDPELTGAAVQSSTTTSSSSTSSTTSAIVTTSTPLSITTTGPSTTAASTQTSTTSVTPGTSTSPAPTSLTYATCTCPPPSLTVTVTASP